MPSVVISLLMLLAVVSVWGCGETDSRRPWCLALLAACCSFGAGFILATVLIGG